MRYDGVDLKLDVPLLEVELMGHRPGADQDHLEVGLEVLRIGGVDLEAESRPPDIPPSGSALVGPGGREGANPNLSGFPPHGP